jgi:hypothetical protein
MTIQSYLNFDLLLSENAGSYQAIVTSHPQGNSKPVHEMQNFIRFMPAR